MLSAAVTALLFAALFGVAAPAVATRVAPRAGAWLLTVGGAVAGACALCVLALLALPVAGRSPEIAETGHWSVRVFAQHDRLSLGLAWTALAILAFLVGRGGLVLVRIAVALRRSFRLSRELGRMAGALVVLPDAEPDAYAVPGRPGRVVVTRGLLRAVSPQSRQLVLAHEQAHLDGGHHWHLAVTALAAAVNPTLSRIRGVQELCVERWADEIAAGFVGRSVAAAALPGVVALIRSPARRPAAAVAVTGSATGLRAAALAAAPLRVRPSLLLVAAICAGCALVATVVCIGDMTRVIDLALDAARGTHR
jgi:Zn-dependent protease with chaperone function